MKLFAVLNAKSDTDFPELEDDFMANDSSNAHSAGIVVFAEDLAAANETLASVEVSGTLVEVDSKKAGIVLFANGDC